MRIGVYLCQTGTGDLDAVDVHSLLSYAANLPNVEFVKDFGLALKIDIHALATEIQREDLERVVIAGDSPGFFKPAFTTAMANAGGDPDEVRLASFREHGASQETGTVRAKSILACAVLGVPFALAAVPDTTPVHPGTLVVGGGVAGIQAALEIADAGKQVFLVERTGTIGGHMAMFDKTFPTLDCAACILTPKMVAVGQHEMIDLMTYSEVEEVSGSPGDFKVKVRRKARRVDVYACVACNACAEVCPQRAASEFDTGIAERKAIYMPFPQAVPNAYLVDAASLHLRRRPTATSAACAPRSAPRDASTSTRTTRWSSSRSATSSWPPATTSTTPRASSATATGCCPTCSPRSSSSG